MACLQVHESVLLVETAAHMQVEGKDQVKEAGRKPSERDCCDLGLYYDAKIQGFSEL